MNAKTKANLIRHGRAILSAFPQATERDPMVLCKKLRRIETVAHRAAVEHAASEISTLGWLTIVLPLKNRVNALLDPVYEAGLFFSRNPDAPSMRLEAGWTRDHNARMRNRQLPTLDYTTNGGEAILSPVLTHHEP